MIRRRRAEQLAQRRPVDRRSHSRLCSAFAPLAVVPLIAASLGASTLHYRRCYQRSPSIRTSSPITTPQEMTMHDLMIRMFLTTQTLSTSPGGETIVGQTTAEYALVMLVLPAWPCCYWGWATKSGAIGELFDASRAERNRRTRQGEASGARSRAVHGGASPWSCP